MPSLQLDSLLGRARDDDEPVFLLVRRRAPISSASVSILAVVAVVLAVVMLLWLLR